MDESREYRRGGREGIVVVGKGVAVVASVNDQSNEASSVLWVSLRKEMRVTVERRAKMIKGLSELERSSLLCL